MGRNEHDKLLDHEYDGIREYDNPMPAWWKGTFWVTFFFSIVYIFYYHFGGVGTSAEEDYAQEMRVFHEQEAALALSAGEVTEEGLAKLMADPAMVAEGGAKYAEVCVACHGAAGEGKIGPNLTDEHWIHGKGSLVDIFGTVNEGVLAKGMPAWGRQLRPDEMRKVVAFVGSLRNTNAANGKAPEGTKVEAVR